MKRTDTFTKLVSLLLFGALLAYLGIYIIQSITNNVRTAPAIYVSLSDNAVASGIIIRQEYIVKSNEKFLSVVAESGQVVSKDEVIAVSYSNEKALQRAAEIKELELKKKYIKSVLSGSQSTENLSDRDSAIKKAISSLSASAIRRDMDNLASSSLYLSSLVIEKNNINATEVDLSIVESQLQTLKNIALHDTEVIRAESTGLFSSTPDGYEHISPDMLSGINPEQLTNIVNSHESITDDVYGKLVNPFEWYFVAIVSQSDAERLKPGASVSLDFGRYCKDQLKARVISISPPSKSECVVVFRCTEAPSVMLFVRRASAEIIFSSHEGIRVPKEAVLSDEKGSFVYTMTGFQAEKKYIEITWETDEYFLASVTENASGLRVGNEIILTTKGLYDGKVMNER